MNNPIIIEGFAGLLQRLFEVFYNIDMLSFTKWEDLVQFRPYFFLIPELKLKVVDTKPTNL